MKSLFVWVVISFLAVSGVILNNNAFCASEEEDLKSQEIVGRVLSVNQEASSFDLEYSADDPAQQKQISTFYITDISTIDIAMAQGSLADLTPGLKVLVEYASMSDGTNVVESVWVKK